MAIEITSATNPRLKNAVKLRSGRHRRRSGLIVVDGIREITRGLASGCELVDLFVARDWKYAAPQQADDKSQELAGLIDDPRWQQQICVVPPPLFDKIQFGERNEGAVAVMRRPQTPLDRLDASGGGLVLVLDALENPGNAGAVLRTADAAGVDGVLFCEPQCELFAPAMIRASLGTCFSVPLGEGDFHGVRSWLHAGRFRVWAARVDAGETLWDADFTGPIAIVLGSESRGLSERWHDSQMQGVRIPMAGLADSLNLAVSAALLAFEARRQRQGAA